MAYTQEQKEELFAEIFTAIENGDSLRKALKTVSLSSKSFYEWLDERDEKGNLTNYAQDKVKQYARACEDRAEALLDEMLDIVDDTHNDVILQDLGDGIVNTITNHEVIQRSRLRYDARKWLVSKLNPKKYGDKIDVTSAGEKVSSTPPEIILNIVPPKED